MAELDVRRTSALPKAPSGIGALDALTWGGFPRGRVTLVEGGRGPAAEHRELYRLRDWILTRGITTLITSRGTAEFASRRHRDVLQFLADCAITLHHRLDQGISQRGVRVLKYRGSGFHETEAPYVDGFQRNGNLLGRQGHRRAAARRDQRRIPLRQPAPRAERRPPPRSTMRGRDTILLRLYVTGSAPNSVRALTNLTEFCRDHLTGRYRIEIVDLEKEPGRAMSDRVFMTPTLVKLSPGPELRIVGSLRDPAPLLAALGLPAERQVAAPTERADG